MYRLKLFAGVSLEGPSGPLEGRVTQRRPLALLALLATSKGGVLSRDKAVSLMWPESDAEQARHRLSIALHAIRKALGAEAVASSGDDLRLDPEVVRTDVGEFEAALTRGDLAEALVLYVGPLLDGFHVQDAPVFERWLDGEQERFAGLYAKAVESLAQQAEEEGDAGRAVELWGKLAAHDPYSSRVAVRLMGALEAAGDRPRALQHARIHATMVREQLGVEPDPDVLALAEALENGEAKRQAVEVPSRPASQPADGPELDQGTPVPGVPTAGPSAEPDASQGTSKRLLFLGAVVGVVLLSIVGLLVTSSRAGAPDDASGTLEPRRIVVTVFENRTGDPELDPVGLMAADWITEGLARTGLLEVVSAPPVLFATNEAASALGAIPVGREWLQEVAEETRAGTIVWGSYYGDGDDKGVQIQAYASDLVTDRLIGSIPPVTASRNAPLEAVGELRQRLLGLLAVHFDERLAEVAAVARRPPTYDAYLAYVAALEATSTDERIEHFRRAHALDSSFVTPLLHALWLIRRANRRIPWEVQDTLIEMLDRAKTSLSPADRALFEAQRAGWSGDRGARYRALLRAAELASDRKWHVAHAAFGGGRYREAVEVWSAGDYSTAWRGYPWFQLTWALHRLRDHERELRIAREGKRENPGSLDFLFMETMALAALGRLEELAQVVEQGRRIGDGGRMPLSSLVLSTGAELMWHDHADLGAELMEEAAGLLKAELEQNPDSLGIRAALAGTLIVLERAEEASRVMSPLMAEDLLPRMAHRDLFAYGRAGVAAARSGDEDEVLRIMNYLRDAQTGDGRTGAGRKRVAHAFWYEAEVAGALGECARAVELIKVALRERGHPNIHGTLGFWYCRDHPAFQQVAKPRG